MGLSDVYKNIGTAYNLQTAVYRFSIVSRVCGINDTDEVQILPQNEVNNIECFPMTETLERLLFLYGAGIIDFKTFRKLRDVKHDISDVLRDAENFLIKQHELYEQERFPTDKLPDVITCAALSKIYAGNDSLTFDDVRNICSLESIKIVNGCVKVADVEMMKLLLDLGELFQHCNEKMIYPEPETDKTNILGNDDFMNGDINAEGYPFMVHPKRLMYYEKIYRQIYGVEFLKYAVKCGLSFDDELIDRYGRYIRRVKCSFDISCYHRKRRICGDIVNQFDYFTNIHNDKPAADGTQHIELKVSREETDETLVDMAMHEFMLKVPVQNETVLEVHNQGKIRLYVLRDEQFIPIEADSFRTQLFDHDSIWQKIQNYAADHNIRAVNGIVEVPMELIGLFSDEERPYAERLIKEQYARQIDNKGGKIISKLSDLMAHAATQMGIAEEKSKLKAKREADKSKRDPSVEGNQ
ncbi:MAG: hypothetical protein II936_02810 [Oscillospiraceae bacterium]|nr:hypothetical protein [Oscillospiraceae bacterium]